MTLDKLQASQAEFDVILTTFNKIELTIECVKALYRNTSAPFNLIVIDDSSDLTPQWFADFKLTHDNVTFVRPKVKMKCGNQSIKIGLDYARTDYIVIMNNSSRVEPEWHGTPLQLLKGNPQIGLIGIKLLYPNGIIWHAGVAFANSQPFHIGVGEMGHSHSHIVEVPCVNPSVGFARKEALMNALDIDTYIGWRGFEDTDLCMTLKKNGWKIAYCGSSSAYHIESPTRLEGDQQTFWKEYNENLRRFLNKWFSDA